MKKTRFLSLLLAILMLLLVSACGADGNDSPAPEAAAQPETDAPTPEAPDSAEPDIPSEESAAVSYPLDTDITLTMAAKLESHMQSMTDDFGKVLAMQQYMEDTGVQVEFTMLGDMVFDEQINLLITSDELPDLIQGGMGSYSAKLQTAVQEDILMDIAPLLEQYAPDYYAIIQNDKNFAENIYNDDGTTSLFCGVGIPVVDAGMYVRGDWMDALNLSDPETISDLTEILRQFRSNYGTTMTLLVNSDLSSGLQNTFNTVVMDFNSLEFQLTAPDSGEVVAGLASDGYFEYLSYLRSLYAEGLIDDSFPSISKMMGTYNGTYWGGVCGVWNEGNRCSDPMDYNSTDPNYLPRPIKNVTTDDGEGTHVLGPGSTVGRGEVYVTAKCEVPEIAVSFMNYAYTEAGINLCSFGIEGETYEWVSEDEVQYTDLIANNPDGLLSREAEVRYLVSNWMPTVQTQAMYNLKNSVKEVREAADLWTANSGDDSMTIPDGVKINDNDIDTVNRLSSDILTLFSERAGMYVMGNIDEAGFKSTVEEAMNTGLAGITEIYQAAYDRYFAAK